jgi:hypothetical protein
MNKQELAELITKQEKELAELKREYKESSDSLIGQFVIVHSVRAGVFVGVLAGLDEDRVSLQGCRKIFRWKGAKTLRELATDGCSLTERTQITDSVPMQLVFECHQVIPCTEKARQILDRSIWL